MTNRQWRKKARECPDRCRDGSRSVDYPGHPLCAHGMLVRRCMERTCPWRAHWDEEVRKDGEA